MTKSNKVWFVTGASKGLGLTLVKRLLNEGFQVAATSRNKNELIKAVGSHDNFLPLEVNLSNENNIQQAVSETLKKFSTIDVLVNNAGYGQGGAVEEVTDFEARKNYEVNVFGLLNVIRSVLPVMRKNKSGQVFNISSLGGFDAAFSGWGVYCSTKFAVSAITEGLAMDVKELGINVTLVYPGYFRTNFLNKESVLWASSPIADYAGAKESMDYHMNTIAGNQPGDPEKAAVAMIKIAADKNPPLHFFMGTDAYNSAHAKMKKVNVDLAKWEELSKSTDY